MVLTRFTLGSLNAELMLNPAETLGMSFADPPSSGDGECTDLHIITEQFYQRFHGGAVGRKAPLAVRGLVKPLLG